MTKRHFQSENKKWKESRLAYEKRKKDHFQKVGWLRPPLGYEQYLNSEAWRKRRDAFMRYLVETGRYYCYKCGAEGRDWFQVHHLNYTRVGDEANSDLRLVCTKCHVAIHPKLKDRMITYCRND